jgi:hypothetical protein
LLVAFEAGSLQKYLKRVAIVEKDENKALKNDEKVLMNFLRACQKIKEKG